MRKIVAPLLLVSALVTAAPVTAETLREALLRAYQTNPTITGARAGQRAVDETVPIARAAGLPSVSAGANFNENPLRGGNSFSSPARSAQANTSLVVPLYQGGAVRNSVRAAETRADAGRINLRGTEANLFAEVVAAYNDVIRDEAIVGLNRQNVRVLEVNLRAARDRFQVGDLTRTDVAQSEARLAVSRAQLQSTEARLIASRENYIRVVGSPPGTLEDPPALPNLPASVDAAVAQAVADNPFLLAAARQREATRFDIGVARASRLPQVSGVVGGNYQNFLGSLGAGTGASIGQTGTSGSLGLALNLPLFQGGRPAALVRQAEARRAQAIEAVTETERAVIAQARSSFAIYRSSLEVIASSEAAVSANRLSLEGVRAENSVGTRTILDILDAEQELLNSQVTLVSARRDAYVAGFNLLAAMGNAEARDLGLDGGALYDPLINYNRVRRRISDFGSDGEPAPVATGTGATTPQDATVTRPLDPAVVPPVDRNRGLTAGSSAPDRQ